MPDSTGLLSQVYVKIDGQDAPDAFVGDLLEVTVESSLHLPDVATLVINDRHGDWTDDERLGPGKSIRIAARVTSDQRPLFDGEVVELEPEYSPGRQRLVLRAFDRLHRLSRGRHVRTFQNVTDGDLIARIAREVGLKASVGDTDEVHAYVLQDNKTNLEFLHDRAVALGYLLYVRADTLHCELPKAQGGPLELKWGKNLGEFLPRLTTIGQIDSATVRGWDPATRQEIVGRSQKGRGAPHTRDQRAGGDLAQSAFSMRSESLVTDRPVRSQAEADRLAQSVMDHVASNFVQAEGVCTGNPALVAGASVELSGIGKRFDGTYFVTGATHTYGHEDGYATRFFVSGHRPATLLGLLHGGPELHKSNGLGLTVGIVTDNQDPDGQARVKVRYPCLSGEHASDWARLVAPGGGPMRGLEFVPEVNDEVLVGFELGDVHHPYVLGGLWNGRDAPPRKTDQLVAGGRVQQRVIRSRTGHTITLDDSDDQPSITIVDKTGKNTIHLESTSNTLTVSVEGDLKLQAAGQVSIHGKTVEVEATDSLSLSGMSTDVGAKNGLSLKGATASLEGQGSTTIKGGTVSIN